MLCRAIFRGDNDAALLDILEAWNSGDAFAGRQLALAAWLNDTTVQVDEEEDVFTGASGEDGFLNSPAVS